MSFSVMRIQVSINTQKNIARITYYETPRDKPVCHEYHCSKQSHGRLWRYMLTHGYTVDTRYLWYGSIYGSKWED